MPQKIRDLLKALKDAGFKEIPGAVTLSGKAGEDAKRYQEKQVAQAIEVVSK